VSQSIQNSNENKPTTVNDHLRELAVRLLVSIAAMGIAGTVVFFFYEPILAFLSSPLGEPLYYSNENLRDWRADYRHPYPYF
jgi:Sec-independent protein secretion pathway component TatC